MDIEIFVFLYLCLMIAIVFSGIYLYHKKDSISDGVLLVYALTVVCIVSYLCGLRGISVGTDTMHYYGFFLSNKEYEFFSLFDEPIIYFVKIFVKLFAGFHFFLFLVSGVISISFLYYSKKVGKSDWILLFVLTISFFLSFDLQVNILKQGMASGLLLAFLVQSKIRYMVLFGSLAVLSHASATIPISLYVISRYIDKDVSLAIYVISIITSFTGVFTLGALEEFFFGLGIERVQQIILTYKYYMGNYKIGFRWDFLLFNSFFLVLFYVNNNKLFRNKKYKDLFVLYVLMSSVFILMFNYPYSDRYGAYSWILIPYMVYLLITHVNLKYRDVWILVWALVNILYLYYHIYGYVI